MGDTGSGCDSPRLQEFVRAKKKIIDIFVEIEGYVRDTDTYMQKVQQVGINVKSDDAVQVKGYIDKVGNIRDILTRNHMKVAFFGSTSNGKSSVINAMLCEKILPTRYGHTTSCFLQVEGTDRVEPYLVIDGSTEERKVESVKQLADALCKEKLEESKLVCIYWPKGKCLLLRDGVVFIDSPGIGMSSKFDDCIDRSCLDADVFVFVVSATSTLALAEMNFPLKVSKQSSKPNIFILNNHWDVVSSEPDDLDEVRAQHIEREVEYLVNELKVCTQEEANQRIFFVSAKEALQTRLQKQKGLPADTGKLADGFPDRYLEFQRFEQKFEECISNSAVRTKFEQHSKSGKHIVSEIRQIINSMYDQAQKLKTQTLEAKKELDDKLKCTKKQRPLLREEMEEIIRQMVKDVKQRVSKALSEEFRNLSVLVDEFKFMFKPEQPYLNEYKKKLHQHVENGLGSKMRASLSTELEMNIQNNQQKMAERMSGLLPAEKKQVLLNTLPQREPFKISYSLNCAKPCTDFHEDLSFSYTERPVSPEEEKAEERVAVIAATAATATSTVLGTTGTLATLELATTAGVATAVGAGAGAAGTAAAGAAGAAAGAAGTAAAGAAAAGAAGAAGTAAAGAAGAAAAGSAGAAAAGAAAGAAGAAGTAAGAAGAAAGAAGAAGTAAGAAAGVTGGAAVAVVATAALAVTVTVGVGVMAYYGSKYLYRHFNWKNAAKEKELKRQFVAHVTKKQQLIVDSTSTNCSNQVQQELSSTLKPICRLVEEEAANKAKDLRNKADDIAKQLKIFDDEFLKPHK